MYALIAVIISTTHKYSNWSLMPIHKITDFLATELIIVWLLFERPTGTGRQLAILVLKNLHFSGSLYQEPRLIHNSSDRIWCTISSIKSLSTCFPLPPNEENYANKTELSFYAMILKANESTWNDTISNDLRQGFFCFQRKKFILEFIYWRQWAIINDSKWWRSNFFGKTHLFRMQTNVRICIENMHMFLAGGRVTNGEWNTNQIKINAHIMDCVINVFDILIGSSCNEPFTILMHELHSITLIFASLRLQF